MQNYSAEYICTHLGEEDAANQNYGAVIPPIYSTSLHVFDDIRDLIGFNAQNPEGKYVYGRVDNPTVKLLETKIAALENAESAICFSSGMAAITSAVLHCVKPGDHIISVRNAYGPAQAFFNSMLKKYGVETTYISGTDPQEFAENTRENTTMYYLESPTSVMFELQNLSEVSAIAKKRGIKTVIDNTWATPIYQHPLELGVDIVIHTMSKYIGGHSDIIGGVLCSGKEIGMQIKSSERELLGGIIGPFEAWLAIRGLRTMPARLASSSKNGQAVAELLEASSRVLEVKYPGLPSFPQYELAKAQMSGCSGLLSFVLDGTPDEAIKFSNNLKLFRKGVSWGGFESLVCMPMYKSTEEDAKLRNSSRSLVRLYCGQEDQASLLADVEAALKF